MVNSLWNGVIKVVSLAILLILLGWGISSYLMIKNTDEVNVEQSVEQSVERGLKPITDGDIIPTVKDKTED